MAALKSVSRAALIGALALLAACAQQPTQPAPQAAAPSQGTGMPGMSGTSGMQGQDHAAMMAQCADMRRQMAQGTHQNMPGMAEMMRHCDEMDRSMGGMPMGSGSTAAPAATRSR